MQQGLTSIQKLDKLLSIFLSTADSFHIVQIRDALKKRNINFDHSTLDQLLKHLIEDKNLSITQGDYYGHGRKFEKVFYYTLTVKGEMLKENGGYFKLARPTKQRIKNTPNPKDINEKPIIAMLKKYWWSFLLPIIIGLILLAIEYRWFARPH